MHRVVTVIMYSRPGKRDDGKRKVERELTCGAEDVPHARRGILVRQSEEATAAMLRYNVRHV